MIDLLVIQPTPFCNINCSYCYLADRDNKDKINEDTIGLIADRVIESKLYDKKITVVWHAGEPMVIPVDYFARLIEIINSKFKANGIETEHSIQTNGTLISQKWCDVINKFNIKIGISIDGPDFIHDHNRKTRNGKGTFQSVMKGIKLLQENNIRYHGIAVISKISLMFPEEIFSFFYDNGFYHVGLNIEELEGIHTSSSLYKEDEYSQIYTFYQALFNKYINSDNRMIIREFDYSLNSILRNPNVMDIRKIDIQSHQVVPHGIISIDYLGNYSTFSPELLGQKSDVYNNFIWGNVTDSGFKKPKWRKQFNAISKEISSGVKKCKKECSFFSVCGGGAPANKYYENNSFNSTETNYCRYTIQVPTSIVLSYLEEKLFN
ncbi:cyclophane-forming radical SAM/SPASM peptide maturase GrrM/OscB [Mucilaginibacter ginsenosidivorax]|uniref:GRRM system radical SAM/SPASM domain protein n=1 Tax=Mucilaginibacter ginsenosidivorax TaxID=862126 RepID=A0A5B8W7P5_9SPHI|nr:cyclophane-forming radical SAM/SPASM peptide maturase GrrM/OscB [Mucilaginibacter ginsenosidivorax]QEC79731.1 GRRM system radical SAM/SPASM domain protein [Mucilaginibacter ginsenosidivorax]